MLRLQMASSNRTHGGLDLPHPRNDLGGCLIEDDRGEALSILPRCSGFTGASQLFDGIFLGRQGELARLWGSLRHGRDDHRSAETNAAWSGAVSCQANDDAQAEYLKA